MMSCNQRNIKEYRHQVSHMQCTGDFKFSNSMNISRSFSQQEMSIKALNARPIVHEPKLYCVRNVLHFTRVQSLLANPVPLKPHANNFQIASKYDYQSKESCNNRIKSATIKLDRSESKPIYLKPVVIDVDYVGKLNYLEHKKEIKNTIEIHAPPSVPSIDHIRQKVLEKHAKTLSEPPQMTNSRRQSFHKKQTF